MAKGIDSLWIFQPLKIGDKVKFRASFRLPNGRIQKSSDCFSNAEVDYQKEYTITSVHDCTYNVASHIIVFSQSIMVDGIKDGFVSFFLDIDRVILSKDEIRRVAKEAVAAL